MVLFDKLITKMVALRLINVMAVPDDNGQLKQSSLHKELGIKVQCQGIKNKLEWVEISSDDYKKILYDESALKFKIEIEREAITEG